MAKSPEDKTAPQRPEPRLPKGFRDIGPAEIRQNMAMLAKIRDVYERYGFEPLETPAIEYTDALGKFLPDQDRPNEGVFSFQDVAPEARDVKGTEPWLSLRYDLTAPLARYVAENFDKLPKPFRRYATGTVFRNEKPGPGRFRQFTQFDADTVGSESVAADAEMCMLAADTMEALGINRGDYVIKVNNRKLIDGVLESAGLAGEENAGRRLIAMRAIDKFDKFGQHGVALLLTRGRKDESGDFTPGAGLSDEQAGKILSLLGVGYASTGSSTVAHLRNIFGDTEHGRQGLDELEQIALLVETAGYGNDRIRIDSSVIRGLEYYTGPVFEAELTFEVKNEDGQTVRFGSVGGGGRYDDLVARFTGQKVPATGFSMGVSRLQAALASLGQAKADALGPVVVLVMDRDQVASYQKMTQKLRNAGIRAEMYLGSSGMKAQMKYADKRGSPVVVIQGGDERTKGEVTLKDLIEGAKAAAAFKDNKEWKAARPAQSTIPEDQLVEAVRDILAQYQA
jgi:histidyl-tRNA synthetase